jgi:two-component system chemotaxis response regulator CheB
MALIKRNIIVIAASAGGVEALCELIAALPEELSAAVFVVMHIGAESRLQEVLNHCGNLPAIWAGDNKHFKNGCVHVAPPHSHLMIKGRTTLLLRGPRENGHRPAADVLFRSAAREHRERVVGVVLSGGRDDGSAGLFAIKARGGVAIVQDPTEAITPNMPQSALEMVDVDYCLPVRQIAPVLVELSRGKANGVAKRRNGGTKMDDQAIAERPRSVPRGAQIPVSCPECNGPVYEAKQGKLTRFHCIIGHSYSPNGLTEEHTEALERALWTAVRRLKERALLHQQLFERKKRTKKEGELRDRLKESVATAERDINLLREVLDRI